MEQMTLDVGQSLIGAIQCEGCGMTYTHGEPTDEATHVKFHQRLLSALKFPGWKNERVIQEFYEGSRILVVLPHEKLFMKKVNAIRILMDEDLGFVVESKNLQNSKTFLYISPDHQVVACCVAEIISKGYRVLSPDSSPMKSPNSSLPRPWCCSNDAEPARCGINRIWVLSSQRRQGIATRLLDAVRNHFIMGYQLSRSELAFTDPTPTGKLLASTYCQTSQFLVYKLGGR
ncbi:hypothetical protein CAPTEDRAFT_159966 [Capitella teleta]|uniref:N-acetyltransferase domain-containing protein n=1 Tax=Capitella teleta TaxID=283909 RepID=R7UDT4_CAPTE|nr:hypothetical protein CAPTEDRAFT_159966 [Capitella teleta]|eukprot:ELU04560.1 hypothetical protein CAPTEDRAFT_159966 [Capitella teleta]